MRRILVLLVSIILSLINGECIEEVITVGDILNSVMVELLRDLLYYVVKYLWHLIQRRNDQGK
ncbi:MAG: hypothetical protein FWD05_10860 [Oscillospiraceae bacterium]|nr:hypothetical protein [Oscillospiraceae bacterium]